MHPVLFELFGFKFYTFGAIVAAAFAVATFWGLHRARAKGENDETYLEGIFWLIITSIVGARLCYLVFFPDQFWGNPVGALFSQGGLVWYGGMVGFIVALFVFCKLRKLNVWRFGDVMGIPAALGLAIGRLGCLMAGCCYGAPCNLLWGITYPHDHMTYPHAVHPTPVYESLALVLVTGFLLWLEKNKKPQDGMIGWLFVVLYGVVRFIIEYFRGDRLVWIESLNLSASQTISLAGVLIGVGVILYLRRKLTH